jgi:DNA-binding transcriptional LysR family regulator
MTLDQLRVFIAVAERQHVTRAAEALDMGQSAVSAAIAALETRHGTKLFHRIGRGIALTHPGELFLNAARDILAQVEAAERLLSDLNGGQRGSLVIMASHTIASYWLPRHLVAFQATHEHIDIRLAIANSAQVAIAVHKGETELGFVEGVIEDPALTITQIARDQMVLVAAPTHPWAGKPTVTPSDLPHTKWVLREPGSGTRSEFEHAITGFGLTMNDLTIALELPSNEAVRGAVEAGLGATAISASAAAPSLEAGLLKILNLALPTRNFYALRHTERFHTQAAQAFLALLPAYQ